MCKPHYDSHNRGPSLLCAFGDYEGGELVIHEGDLSGNYDVRHNPLTTDFSKVLHSVKPFTGNRYSVVYYYFEIKPWIGREYLKGEVRFVGGDYVFYRGGVKCTGLPHPLNGFKRKPKIDKSADSVEAKDGTD